MEGLLLGIGFIGLVLALLTPRSKIGAAITLISFSAYFFLIGMNQWFPIALFVLGLVLLIIEVFIPDFGLVGISGILLIVGGIYLTIGDVGQTIRDLSLAILVTASLVYYLIKKGYSFENLNQIILQTNLEAKEEKAPHPILESGTKAIASTDLRPSGKAIVKNGHEMELDVLSISGHIAKGEEIIIEKVSGSKITVRRENT
ncbi:hydrolase [Lacticigenium naphthae]|uniref:hydrolase n=1 Tax=Lacticigenium naphthae TaxID=515351 RepID=UPI0004298649|nr:hydrolase [Lacticigenium naphthae]